MRGATLANLMRRATSLLLSILLLVAVPAVALGQAVPSQPGQPPVAPIPGGGQGQGPLGPLPQPAPEQTATPTLPGAEDDDEAFGRRTLYIILGIVALGVVGIAYFISRDARRRAPVATKATAADDPLLAAAGERARRQRTKKQRAKQKAARKARKRTTRSR